MDKTRLGKGKIGNEAFSQWLMESDSLCKIRNKTRVNVLRKSIMKLIFENLQLSNTNVTHDLQIRSFSIFQLIIEFSWH
jgi:hypothetical protein